MITSESMIFINTFTQKASDRGGEVTNLIHTPGFFKKGFGRLPRVFLKN